MKPSLLKKILLLVAIPLIFEIGLVAILLDMQHRVQAEKIRVDRARQITALVSKICRDDIELEDTLDTANGPLEMEHGITSKFNRITKSFDELEFLTRPESKAHDSVINCIRKMQNVAGNMRILKQQPSRSPNANSISIAREFAPEFKKQVRGAVSSGFFDLADFYSNVLSSDQSSELNRQMESFLTLAVAISILIAAGSAAYLSSTLSSRMQKLAANARRLGRREPLDVTVIGDDEIGLVDAAIHQASSDLINLDTSREEVIAMVSHDIRSPVTTIKMASELLKRLCNDSSRVEIDETIDEIDSNCERILAISRDLLDLQKFESGTLTLQKNVFSVQDCLQSALLSTKGISQRRNVNVIFFGDNFPLLADRSRLEQVLTNLITNAIKVSPANNEVAVGARVDKATSNVLIEVLDRGPGLSKYQLEKVFEKFARIRQKDGHRLGAYNC